MKPQGQMYHLDTDEQMEYFRAHVARLRLSGKRVRVGFIVEDEKKRSPTQNASLHKFLTELAEVLNNSGYDMVTVLNEGTEIPWTMESAKSHLWKPIQKAMLNKESTTDANTTDYNKVYQVLTRHLGQKLGILVPQWPTWDRE